jgi:hypothetical protein
MRVGMYTDISGNNPKAQIVMLIIFFKGTQND